MGQTGAVLECKALDCFKAGAKINTLQFSAVMKGFLIKNIQRIRKFDIPDARILKSIRNDFFHALRNDQVCHI